MSDLSVAKAHWEECKKQYKECCSGEDDDHVWFHGIYWDGAFGNTIGDLVEVNCGVSFYADHARTYYLRDFDHHADSKKYGEKIPYSLDDFWDRMLRQIAAGPEVAWDDGLRSCHRCGYHHFDGCSCGIDEEAKGGQE